MLRAGELPEDSRLIELACEAGLQPFELRDYLRAEIERRPATEDRRILGGITAHEDIASVAGQLAELTHTVEEMAAQLRSLQEHADHEQKRADSQQERAEIQQERIDLAARELAEVSARLQAAANALRGSL